MSISENLQRVRASLPEGVQLVAVSKYHTEDAVRECYAAGQRAFGESREQELREKHQHLPEDIAWHFIGHLQTNKVKYIAPYVALIHAIDTPRLLREVHRQGERLGRRIPCLLQIHVAQEETKFGFAPQECIDYLSTGEWRQLPFAEIRGLMCMASNTDDEARIRRDFRTVRDLFERIKAEYFPSDERFSLRSYGMSHDYRIAIEEGANIVRVGSAIFD